MFAGAGRGAGPCALANDLTKKFEDVHRSTLSEAIAMLSTSPPRGEYTVVIGGAGPTD